MFTGAIFNFCSAFGICWHERFEFTTETLLVLASGIFKNYIESPTETSIYDNGGSHETADSKYFTDQLRLDVIIENNGRSC